MPSKSPPCRAWCVQLQCARSASRATITAAKLRAALVLSRLDEHVVISPTEEMAKKTKILRAGDADPSACGACVCRPPCLGGYCCSTGGRWRLRTVQLALEATMNGVSPQDLASALCGGCTQILHERGCSLAACDLEGCDAFRSQNILQQKGDAAWLHAHSSKAATGLAVSFRQLLTTS